MHELNTLRDENEALTQELDVSKITKIRSISSLLTDFIGIEKQF